MRGFSNRLAAGVLSAVLVALTLGPVAVAQAQTADTSTTAITCANPPAGVTATVEQRDRFVALWAPRVNERAFMQGFIDASTVPAAIRAEGFHDLDRLSQGWLVICLVERLIATVGVGGNPPGVTPEPARLEKVQASLGLVIFGKDALNTLKESATEVTPVTDPSPSAAQNELTAASDELAATAVPPPPDASQLIPSPPTPAVISDLSGMSTDTLTELLSGAPTPVSVDATVAADASVGTPVASANVGALVSTGLNGSISFPVVDPLVKLIDSLLKDVVELPATLLATPPLSALSGATYRVCRESADLALACTVPIPVGVPVPVGLTDDVLPDVLAHLTPQPNPFALQDVTVGFKLTRLPTAPPGPLAFHVFAVYDPPLTGKRLAFGYDARPSTLADETNGTATVKNVFSALQADLNVQLKITHKNPGAVEAETVAIKTLVSQGTLKPLKEEDPLAGAVRFAPVPTSLTADLRLQRLPTHEQSTLTLTSSVASRVDAHVSRDLTTTTPKSHQEIRGLVDQLPTSATVDLIRQGDQTKIHYFANAGIGQVSAADKLVPDVARPGSYTESIYDVLGVPTDVRVTLTGGSDVEYKASSSVPKASVSKASFTDGVVQTAILGVVEQIPTDIHLNIANAGDNTTVTYDANTSLGKAQLLLFDRAQDETTLEATATAFPTHAVLTAAKGTGVVDYSANGPIGLIDARVTRAGGGTLSLAGDHATVLKQGAKLGVELVLSGLQAFHVEPSQKALYSLTLNPGGQPFKAVADLDSPNVLATLEVSNLPSTIAVTMDPAAGAATYQASSVINSAKARFDQRATGMVGLVELEDIPQSIDVGFTTGGATPQVTYDASGKLGKLHAFYLEKPGGTAFDALIESLPEYFEVAGQDPFSFDARSGPAAPPGSSSLGKLTFKYASDGSFATSPTADDHVLLKTGPATEAELVYSGLRFVSLSTASKELHADLRNTAKRLFRVFLDTPTLLVEGVVDGVPDEVKFDLVGQTAKYRATSPVDQVAVDIDRRNGDTVAVDVTGIPSSIDLVLDSAASTVDWTASAPTSGLGVVARFGPSTTGTTRTFDTSLTLTGIPARWRSSHASGHPRFEGLSGPIGTLAATFTNHGATTVLSGDHLSAVFDQPSGDLDTSLRISNLSLADFETLNTGSGGFRGDLNMGNGSPFGLNAQVNLGANRLSANGTISNLPSAMHIESTEGRFQYTGNTNPTIQLSAQYGSSSGLAGTPTPPAVHGLSVRDGNGAIKANLFLTGFPKLMDFDPKTGVYRVGDFAPSLPLVIDAALDNLVPTPLTVLVTQAGIPSGVDFTFGPTTTTTLGDGTAQTHLGYVASAAMGQLTAGATFGTNEAFFQASSVPSSMSIDTSFGPATKTVGVLLGSPVSQIKANFRHVGDATFAAGVQLDDVPTKVDLTIGKKDGGEGVTTPVFTYKAATAGLDITAFARASLFGGDIQAAVDVNAVNLGAVVTADLVGKTLSLTSNPATQSFNLLASGRLNFNVDLAFTAGPLRNTGTLNVDLIITRFRVAFTDMSSLTLKAGITSAIEGSYGTFTIEERSNLFLTIEDHLVVETGFGDFPLIDFGPHTINPGDVVGNFRLAGNHLGNWVTALPTPLPCDVDLAPPDVDFLVVTVQLKPHPHATTPGPSFTVAGAAAEGGAHIVTVNPFGFLPDFVLDIIARFATPLNNGDQGLGTVCPD